MTVEDEKDLIALKKIGKIVASCLKHMGETLEPGITTKEVDDIGARFLADRGARSAPQLTYNFPGATCISVGNEIAHGIPGNRKITAGDMVNIDVSAELDGYFADTGGSFVVPPQTKPKRRICEVTRSALTAAIKEARAGRPINVIGQTIESVATKNRVSIIRNLGSHGVGRALHEEPEFIASYFDARDKRKLKKGAVITIEPFLSTGATLVEEADDGWTLYTATEFLSAQYEHTIVIREGVPIIVTMV